MTASFLKSAAIPPNHTAHRIRLVDPLTGKEKKTKKSTALDFAHIHVVCRDLEAMLQFWTRGLGAVCVEQRLFSGSPGAVLRCGPIQINVKQSGQLEEFKEGTSGFEHVAFYTPDPEQSAAKLVSEFGCTITTRLPGGMVFVSGPEGLLIEFMKPKK